MCRLLERARWEVENPKSVARRLSFVGENGRQRSPTKEEVRAEIEELHLIDGELWINERLLRAGDYNYGEPGAFDERVFSETGCTCVLITSPSDRLS